MSTFIELDSLLRDRVAYPNPCDYVVDARQTSTWVRSAREVRAFPQSAASRPQEFVTTVHITSLNLPYPRIELYSTESVVVTSIDVTGTIFTTVNPLPAGFVIGAAVKATFATNSVNPNTTYFLQAVGVNTFSLDIISPPGAPVVFIPGNNLNLPFFLLTPAVQTQLSDALQILDIPRLYVDFHSQSYNDSRLINCIDGVHSDIRFIVVHDRVLFDSNNMPIWIVYRGLMEQTLRFKRDDPQIFRITGRNELVLTAFIDDDITVSADPNKQVIIDFTLTPYIRDATYDNHVVETRN